MDPDAALMLRVQRGDRAAFTELVEKHRQTVMNFVARTLRDPVEAEDIAQASFIQVFKCAQRYEPSARFTTWLFTIARNLCLNELRRRARHPAESLDVTHPEHEDQPRRQFVDCRAAPPSDDLLHDELLAMIEDALAALPETQRTALLLCREEELSYEEIAAVLGCSVSATKSIIHRGRETLRSVLKPYLRSGVWLSGVSQL
jgi:RNA polymerase sigma-70 factor (ECF subfamily)